MSAVCDDIFVDFGIICRLCLSEDAEFLKIRKKEETLSEFANDESENDVDVIETLSTVTGIKISDSDILPLWICTSCFVKLQEASSFIQTCISSQAFLEDSFQRELAKAGLHEEEIKVIIKGKHKEVDNRLLETKKIEDANTKFTEEPTDIDTVTMTFNFLETNSSVASCDDCSLKFETNNELTIHRISVHHDDLVDVHGLKMNRVRPCEKCRAKLNSGEAYNIHMQSHAYKHLQQKSSENSQSVSCRYCGEIYMSSRWSSHCEISHRVSKKEQAVKKSADCYICLRPFVRVSALCNHIQKHHAQNMEEFAEKEGCTIVWVCKDCDDDFGSDKDLIQHYSEKHGKKPTDITSRKTLQPQGETCECGYIMSTPMEDRLHEVFLHPDRNIMSCPACDETYLSLQDLQIHIVKFHNFISVGLENQCLFCEESCLGFDVLRSHLRMEHDIIFESEKTSSDGTVREYARMGSVVNFSPAELLTHIEESQDVPTIFQCESCDSYFKSKQSLMDHECLENKEELIESHEGHICPTCGKSFISKMNLHNHFKRRHLGLARRFVCSYCGKSLKGSAALRSHEDRLHRGVRRYPCPDCSQAFTTAGFLRKHSEQHMAERPMHTCEICGKRFTTISGFSRHVATHEGNKNYVCSMDPCRKAFYTKSELRRHIKFHTQDFQHTCEVCGHKFVAPGELRKHRTKHTGEKPYRCHICPAAYARRDDKVKHMKRVHHLRIKRVYGPQSEEVYVQEI